MRKYFSAWVAKVAFLGDDEFLMEHRTQIWNKLFAGPFLRGTDEPKFSKKRVVSVVWTKSGLFRSSWRMAVAMVGDYPTKFCIIWDVTGRVLQFCDSIWRKLENNCPPTPLLSCCLECQYDGWPFSSHKEYGHSSDTARCYEKDTTFCLVQTSVNFPVYTALETDLCVALEGI